MDRRLMTPNSHKYKEEEATRKKKEKIVKGKVSIKKKSFLSNLINDDIGSIGDYILNEVLIPTIKRTIVTVINGSTEKIFGVGRLPSSSATKATRPNYDYTKPGKTSSSKAGYELDTIIFEERSDAEDVKDQLSALIETYRCASVADLYDLIGRDSEFTDNNYGWVSLKDITVTFTGDGYKLNLPRPMVLR